MMMISDYRTAVALDTHAFGLVSILNYLIGHLSVFVFCLGARIQETLNGAWLEFFEMILGKAVMEFYPWIVFCFYWDPVWAISSDTISSLIGLSLNFFFILPLTNLVGIHLIEAPVLHPMSEGLFNLVIAWTLMFAPLLYTDKLRDRFKGSIDVLWGFQMFLTNTFLIPYMAIRLNVAQEDDTPRKTSQLGSVMTNGAAIVGLTGGLVSVLSIVWAFYGRGDGNFGDLGERLEFLQSYLGSERLAYAFIWDICLYLVFQPWLIGDNLQNIRQDKVASVNLLRFVPVVGLVAYCLCLDTGKET
ncbi:uncharacterized protein LOC121790819 [Salvia splendens]|uniref:uncharacterized protein LOC121790819 n=1 Tax=Salvia splendens TaxID=180675 RepID=UPI001C266805|nr:uncharacterized protein LOC121790819 [Salvia splendens]